MKYKVRRLLAAFASSVILGIAVTITVLFVNKIARNQPGALEQVSPPEVVQHTKAPDIDEDPWTPEIERQRAELARLRELQSKQPKVKSKLLKIRRYKWESPSFIRGKVWNVPEEESVESVITGFLRICIAESDGHLPDCVGIWQVINNVRSRSCNRRQISRITECGDDGETVLSAMRRAQRHVMGMVPIRSRRARWIRNLNTDCEVPESWTAGTKNWNKQYLKRCTYAVELGRGLIKGVLRSPRPGSRLRYIPGVPIAWGGRCESGQDACDDPIACSRGLVRIKGTGTYNAFWKRPRNRDEVDPICKQLGY